MISENIKAIREKKGIKQSDIARALGIEPTNYPRIEKREKRLTIEMLEKIAEVLGVSILELLGYNSSPQPERIKELEGKVIRLRTANKVLRHKNDLLYSMASLFRKSANELIDKENKRFEEEEEDFEELKRQANELGIDLSDIEKD
ncbi:helix-turn-helix transcriptional regulator [Spirosoma sp.]|uniref:helix-turn-helix domain-containing protein n=1 Tax=Spirosoma sp. TaxID=1899569 RepID=UPI002637E0DE|nr:helix-turn-helix transcriptional regulator [Spirosoma sp.]MCX6218300.1 helix-turn-helix transcriptional regulator [Spirosoma sp.]